MIDIWYCDTTEFTEADLHMLLDPFSPAEKEAVLRFHFLKDRLFRVIGRTMVSLKLQCEPDTIQKTPAGKPFVMGSSRFNISHAGTVVAVAFSDEEIGLDIETNNTLEQQGIMSYFHPDEQRTFHGLNEDSKQAFFYRIWTRKEAFLKAIGVGIVEGLNTYNCLPDRIERAGEHWFIQSIDELRDYACAICQKNSPITTFQLKKLDKTTILQQHEKRFL